MLSVCCSSLPLGRVCGRSRSPFGFLALAVMLFFALPLALTGCSDDPAQPGRPPMNVVVGGLDPDAPSFEEALAEAVPGDTITVADGMRITVATTQVVPASRTPLLVRTERDKNRGTLHSNSALPVLRFDGALPGTRVQFLNFTGSGDLLASSGGTLEVNGCDFEGGQVAVQGSGNLTCTQSLFQGGTVGVEFNAGPLRIENCTFIEPSQSAISMTSATATIRANLVVRALIDCAVGSSLAAGSGCNNLWNSVGASGWSGCEPPENDFNLDPQFCDEDNGDFTLVSTSPCSPVNSPEGCDLIGARPVACEPEGP